MNKKNIVGEIREVNRRPDNIRPHGLLLEWEVTIFEQSSDII